MSQTIEVYAQDACMYSIIEQYIIAVANCNIPGQTGVIHNHKIWFMKSIPHYQHLSTYHACDVFFIFLVSHCTMEG